MCPEEFGDGVIVSGVPLGPRIKSTEYALQIEAQVLESNGEIQEIQREAPESKRRMPEIQTLKVHHCQTVLAEFEKVQMATVCF